MITRETHFLDLNVTSCPAVDSLTQLIKVNKNNIKPTKESIFWSFNYQFQLLLKVLVSAGSKVAFSLSFCQKREQKG